MKELSCSFTGHRIIPSQDAAAVKERLYKAVSYLVKGGYTDFLCGGALGFDMMAAIEVIRYKKENGNIRLILALPCKNWDSRWNSKSREIYKKIIEKADSVIYVSEEYTPYCMHKRNRYLIDNSKVCIAYYAGGGGGTAYTVKYAMDRGTQVYNLKEYISGGTENGIF